MIDSRRPVFAIEPYVGVGPLRIGMPAETIRDALGAKFTSFKKGPMSLMPTDGFTDLGVHVFYRSPGICTAVEFGKPARVLLDGQELLGVAFDRLLAMVQGARSQHGDRSCRPDIQRSRGEFVHSVDGQGPQRSGRGG